jgi:hypothetical protein
MPRHLDCPSSEWSDTPICQILKLTVRRLARARSVPERARYNSHSWVLKDRLVRLVQLERRAGIATGIAYVR